MTFPRILFPVALLMAGTLMCGPANADSKRPFRRLIGKTKPQRAAKQHQLKPERFKVKEPPDWVPQPQSGSRGLSGRRRPIQAMRFNIKPERYKAKEPPDWVPQRTTPTAKFRGLRPDLLVKQYDFGDSKKIVRVRVANVGRVAAGASKLRLTVRRINGTPVGRMTTVVVPAIPANSSKWVSIDTTEILPVAVALKSTTFRLDADATKVVAESKETNNTRWHNLP